MDQKQIDTMVEEEPGKTIDTITDAQWGKQTHRAYARAIESAVRQQYEPVLQQLVDALLDTQGTLNWYTMTYPEPAENDYETAERIRAEEQVRVALTTAQRLLDASEKSD